MQPKIITRVSDIDISELTATLLQKGYAVIKYPLITQYNNNLLQTFKEFQAQPMEFRMKWNTSFPPTDKGRETGFIPWKGMDSNGGFYDNKESFMYRNNIRSLIGNQISTEESMMYYAFIHQFDQLLTQFLALTDLITTQLDIVVPGYNLNQKFMSPEAQNYHSIRLVDYKIDTPMGMQELGARDSASEHYDRDGLTIQCFETDPGLIITGNDGKDFEYASEPDSIAIFPGRKMEHITGGKIKAVKHRVHGKRNRNRYAGIGFMHTTDEIPHNR